MKKNREQIKKIIRYREISRAEPFLCFFLNSLDWEINKELPAPAAVSPALARLIVNPTKTQDYDLQMWKTLLMHEALHLLLDHGVSIKTSNLAQDLAINSSLCHSTIRKMNGVLPDSYDLPFGKTSVWYDDNLTDEQKQQFPHFEPRGGELEDLTEQLQDMLKNEARGLEAGTGNSIIDSYIGIKDKPELPWGVILRRWLASSVTSEKIHTKRRYNKRFPHMSGSYKKRETDILVAIDYSGSVSDELLGSLLTELKGIARNANVKVVPFTDVVHSDMLVNLDRYSSHDFSQRQVCGGTSFDAAYDYWKQEHKKAKLIVLTDGRDTGTGNRNYKRDCLFVVPKGFNMSFDTRKVEVNV